MNLSDEEIGYIFHTAKRVGNVAALSPAFAPPAQAEYERRLASLASHIAAQKAEINRLRALYVLDGHGT